MGGLGVLWAWVGWGAVCLFMGMGGLVVGGFLASSLYTSYEAKYFKMKKENSSEIYFRFKKNYEVIMKQIFKKALTICVLCMYVRLI